MTNWVIREAVALHERSGRAARQSVKASALSAAQPPSAPPAGRSVHLHGCWHAHTHCTHCTGVAGPRMVSSLAEPNRLRAERGDAGCGCDAVSELAAEPTPYILIEIQKIGGWHAPPEARHRLPRVPRAPECTDEARLAAAYSPAKLTSPAASPSPSCPRPTPAQTLTGGSRCRRAAGAAAWRRAPTSPAASTSPSSPRPTPAQTLTGGAVAGGQPVRQRGGALPRLQRRRRHRALRGPLLHRHSPAEPLQAGSRCGSVAARSHVSSGVDVTELSAAHSCTDTHRRSRCRRAAGAAAWRRAPTSPAASTSPSSPRPTPAQTLTGGAVAGGQPVRQRGGALPRLQRRRRHRALRGPLLHRHSPAEPLQAGSRCGSVAARSHVSSGVDVTELSAAHSCTDTHRRSRCRRAAGAAAWRRAPTSSSGVDVTELSAAHSCTDTHRRSRCRRAAGAAAWRRAPTSSAASTSPSCPRPTPAQTLTGGAVAGGQPVRQRGGALPRLQRRRRHRALRGPLLHRHSPAEPLQAGSRCGSVAARSHVSSGVDVTELSAAHSCTDTHRRSRCRRAAGAAAWRRAPTSPAASTSPSSPRPTPAQTLTGGAVAGGQPVRQRGGALPRLQRRRRHRALRGPLLHRHSPAEPLQAGSRCGSVAARSHVSSGVDVTELSAAHSCTDTHRRSRCRRAAGAAAWRRAPTSPAASTSPSSPRPTPAQTLTGGAVAGGQPVRQRGGALPRLQRRRRHRALRGPLLHRHSPAEPLQAGSRCGSVAARSHVSSGVDVTELSAATPAQNSTGWPHCRCRLGKTF
ncbi:hypothetical protein ACJJTC_009548 [Scirpophaga incertulas]